MVISGGNNIFEEEVIFIDKYYVKSIHKICFVISILLKSKLFNYFSIKEKKKVKLLIYSLYVHGFLIWSLHEKTYWYLYKLNGRDLIISY